MKKLLIILALLLPINANAGSVACQELGEVAELIAIAKIAGMPKIIMVTGVKVDKTGMPTMDNFALNLIEAAYSYKHLTVDKFRNKTVRACEKLMVKKEKFKWLGSK